MTKRASPAKPTACSHSAAFALAALLAACGRTTSTTDGGGVELESGTPDAALDASAFACEGPRPRVPVGFCSSSNWCWEHPRPQGVNLRAVWATARDDVWAVGEYGMALHGDGRAWTRVDLSTHATLHSVWASAPNDVWITGGADETLGAVDPNGSGTLLHYDGGSWSRVRFPSSFPPATSTTVWGTSSRDVWFGGGPVHWNGTTFEPPVRIIPEGVFRLTGTGPHHVLALSGDGHVYRWDGARWSNDLPFGERAWGARGIHAFASDDVWVTRSARGLAHWDGRTWQLASLHGLPDEFYAVEIWGATPEALWLVGNVSSETDAHFIARRRATGEVAIAARVPENLNAMAGAAADAIWAVGNGGLIMQFDGASWSVVGDRVPLAELDLRDTWGMGCDRWSVGFTGGWQNPRGAILRQVGQSWTPVDVDLPPLNAIWGSAVNDVWAVGEQGTAVHWNGAAWTRSPTGFTGSLRGVWGSRNTDVWAVGENERNAPATLLHFDGTRWEPVTVLGPPDRQRCEDQWMFMSVWGARSDDVWVAGVVAIPCGSIGGTGVLLHWNGATWSVVPSADDASGGAPDWSRVTGSGPNDVWTVGRALHHWDGSSWSRHELPRAFGAVRVWASNARNAWVVGVSGRIAHWDGVGFTELQTDSNVRFWSVFGTSADDVWAVGDGGAILRWGR